MGISWDEYFFSMISIIREKSKDPSTKVGCVIVGNDNEVLSTGFNGFPKGVIDSINEAKRGFKGIPLNYVRDKIEFWGLEIEKRYNDRTFKYKFTEHAERNAIYLAAKRGTALEGSKIYIDRHPCTDCCRGIIQSGIKEIIIDERNKEIKKDFYERWKEDIEITKIMCNEAKINIRCWEG